MQLTFLGTGTSTGIPIIGCKCAICQSENPKDKRTRTSAAIHVDGKALLIDTAPELRLQAVATGLDRVDAVLYTHAHADHVGGFDDLRRYNLINQARLLTYADIETTYHLQERFPYAFEYPFPFFGGKPDLKLITFSDRFTVDGTEIEITPIPVMHGGWDIHGFRIRDLVYVTDAKKIPDSSIELMRDASVLVLNALRHEPHPVHLSLGEALAIIEEVQPDRAFLVHMSHELGHDETNALLPEGVELAYDGLVVDV